MAEVRAEVLALDTQLIEKFWMHLEHNISTGSVYSRAQVFPVQNSDGLLEIRAEFDSTTKAALAKKVSENIFENIWLLRDSFSAMATFSILQFTAGLEAASDNEDYRRLKELLGQENLSAGIAPAFRVPAHLHKGLRSGIYASFDMVRALPLAFWSATQNLIREEDFRSLAQKSLPLLTNLSGMDIKSYVSLRDGAKKYFPENLLPPREKSDYEFPWRFFVYQGDQNRLGINPQYFEKWKSEYVGKRENETSRPGCPARLSKNGSKSTVVRNLYEMQIENFMDYAFPHIKNYVESGSVK